LGTVEEAEVKYPRELERAMGVIIHAVREQASSV
jgi:hypothetical protein